MANLNAKITNFVAGDDLEIRRTVTNVPVANGLDRAAFTVKLNDDDLDAAAIFTKTITTTSVATQGHISDTGITDGVATLRFFLQDTDTVLLTPNIEYWYDITVREAVTGALWTIEIGRIVARRQINISGP